VSLLSAAVGAVRALADGESRPISEWTGDSWLAGRNTDAGVAVNSETSMRLSAVYGSRRIIAYTIACLPARVLVKKDTPDGRTKRLPYRPAPQWLSTPNKDQTWPEFAAQAVDSLLGDGNLFIDTHKKDRDGRPAALFVVNPTQIVVGRRTDDNELFYATVRGEAIPQQDLLHVRALTLPGHDRGLSPIEMARQEVGLGQAAQKFSAKFYVNGATVSALLEFPSTMTKEEVTEAAGTFKEMYVGSDKAHVVAAVAGATYRPMGITLEQAQFLESRQFTVVDIGTRIYGVPPHRLGALLDKPQFGNSIEQQNMSFVQDAILPWTTLLEAVFNRHVVPSGAYLHLELNGLMRGDAKSRAAFYQTMRQQLGVFNGDDILGLEDMDPMPDGKGQAYWMPANTYLVGKDGFPILPERQPEPRSALDPLELLRAEKVQLIRERRAQDAERGRDMEATHGFAERVLPPLADAYRLAGRRLDTNALLEEALS
jgi:HK97 family phage portal protein